LSALVFVVIITRDLRGEERKLVGIARLVTFTAIQQDQKNFGTVVCCKITFPN